jgi:hypothetical protein
VVPRHLVRLLQAHFLQLLPDYRQLLALEVQLEV